MEVLPVSVIWFGLYLGGWGGKAASLLIDVCDCIRLEDSSDEAATDDLRDDVDESSKSVIKAAL